MDRTYQFTVITIDSKKAQRDFESLGIYGLDYRAAAVTGHATERQLKELVRMGYEVDCWDLNSKLYPPPEA